MTTRTIVIGSTGHAHVTSVPWSEADSVNLVDFGLVVITCRALTPDFLANMRPWEFFEKVRKKLARVLASGGRVVAIGIPAQSVYVQSIGRSRHAYSWSPVYIETVDESGSSVEIKTPYFSSYLKKLSAWQYWYDIPQGFLTHELTELCGATSSHKYELSRDILVANREGRPLAITCTISVRGLTAVPSANSMVLGPLTFLPDIEELETRVGVNLVLEDLLGIPQETIPPQWTESISVPGISDFDNGIRERTQRIGALKSEIESLEEQRSNLQEWRKLVYESGIPLENIFSASLAKLGATLLPASYSNEEFIFEFQGMRGLVECKGVGGSAAIKHVRQIDDYVLTCEEAEGIDGKGVLFVNAWRDLPLDRRGTPDKPVFPSNVINRASERGIALVASETYFEAFCSFLEGRIEGSSILLKLLTTDGVVEF